jgi:putative ABC transport system permease protein
MTLLTDLRIAMRSLWRRPTFTLFAAGTLALGVGGTAAIFSVANGVLLRALPYPEPHELVVIWEDDRLDPSPELGGMVSAPNFRDIEAAAASFETMAQYRSANLTLSGEAGAELVPGGEVSRQLFRVFGADPILGRAFSDEETRFGGPDAVVLSEGFWRDRFGGDPGAIGATLMISGRPHRVVGVTPSGFGFPSGARLWVPMKNNDESCGRGCVLYAAVGRLRADIPVERATAELASLATQLERAYPDQNSDLALRALPLREVVVGDVKRAVWILFGAVGMVLLVACANVANLILARGGSRRAELAVRTALGAPRGAIVQQLMAENALLAVLGGTGGLLLAVAGVPVLVRLAPAELPRLDQVAVDGATLLVSLGLVLLTTILFGLIPATRLADEGMAEAIRRSGPGGMGDRRGHRTRSFMLTAEVALSVVLLLGAGLLLRTLDQMQSVELGIETSDVVTFRLSLPSTRYDGPAARVAFIEQLEERLSGIPGVQSVATIVAMPFGPVWLTGSFSRADRPTNADDRAEVKYRALDPDAFDVFGIDLAAGRGFTAADRHGAAPVAMINRTAADRYWPGEDPIGKQIHVHISVGYAESEPRTIIGITDSFRTEVTSAAGPELYVPYAQAGASFPHVALKVAGIVPPSAVLTRVREELAAADPHLPMAQAAALADLVDDQMAATRFYLMLLGLFAAIALILAAVGVYGVVALLVVQRTREIGMRIALGARTHHVVLLVLGESLAPAAAGLTFGLLGALAFGGVMAGILYGVEPTDPLTYVGSAILLFTVVIAATALPARRASRIPPAEALRAR